EAILGVNKPQSAGSVESIRGVNRRNPELIAVDENGRAETRKGACSIELWQARRQLNAGPDRGGDHQRHAEDRQRAQRLDQPLPETRSVWRLGRCGTCGQFVAHRNTFRVLSNAAAKNTRATQFTETRSAAQTGGRSRRRGDVPRAPCPRSP